jgi:hypothetical protein
MQFQDEYHHLAPQTGKKYHTDDYHNNFRRPRVGRLVAFPIPTLSI